MRLGTHSCVPPWMHIHNLQLVANLKPFSPQALLKSHCQSQCGYTSWRRSIMTPLPLGPRKYLARLPLCGNSKSVQLFYVGRMLLLMLVPAVGRALGFLFHLFCMKQTSH